MTVCVYYLLFFPTSHRIVCVFAYHSIISLQRMKKKWRKKMFAQIQLYLPSWWSCLLSTNLVPTNCQYCCCCCCCCMNRESSFFSTMKKKILSIYPFYYYAMSFWILDCLTKKKEKKFHTYTVYILIQFNWIQCFVTL